MTAHDSRNQETWIIYQIRHLLWWMGDQHRSRYIFLLRSFYPFWLPFTSWLSPPVGKNEATGSIAIFHSIHPAAFSSHIASCLFTFPGCSLFPKKNIFENFLSAIEKKPRWFVPLGGLAKFRGAFFPNELPEGREHTFDQSFPPFSWNLLK